MLRVIVLTVLSLVSLRLASSQNLNGVFLIDSCKCNSSSEACEPSGPFIFNQKRTTLAIRYGSQQVGVGSLGSSQLDLLLNQKRCKGTWNTKTHSAELKCQHQGGVFCKTNLRCLSGSCLEDTSIVISSAATSATLSGLLVIAVGFVLV